MVTKSTTVAAAALAIALTSPAPGQPDPARAILEAEHARAEDVTPIRSGLASSDVRLQRLAARALGRLERREHAEALVPLVTAPDPDVRREAINALGQIGAEQDYASWLTRERDARVRAVIYETIGRVPPVPDVTERVLAAGLDEPEAEGRRGAARGLESFVRRNIRSLTPAAATVAALRRAIVAHADRDLRLLVLLALNTARDRDAPTLEVALADADPQVRRLAVMGLRRWLDDPSPIVRYEALRLAATCERAVAAVADESEHVALLAVDRLGTLPCAADVIEPLLSSPRSWRMRAHALVSLARVAPDAARRHLNRFAADPIWQVRVYAANAAKLVKDEDIRSTLAADAEPNVALAAMATSADAIRALDSSHRGLLIAAAEQLEGAPELASAAPKLLDAFERLSREERPTSRDARIALLDRIGEVGRTTDPTAAAGLRPWLADRDPRVAARVAEVLRTLTAAEVAPVTTRYRYEPLPDDAVIAPLRGATARFTMRGLGTFVVELLTDDAPATVATFAAHAEAGGYDGTTFHRVVSNFVLQGGSPGAHEMDGAVGPFMPDALGLARNARGTLGTSTRGRDTGDGQIFINLVDNVRLDHDYTVWARVIEGLDLVDRIQEGDVIEAIEIVRSGPAR
jgi:cyclophilin family peptidyl-prolyl cis-trans isomerase/HEAT repeat protein